MNGMMVDRQRWIVTTPRIDSSGEIQSPFDSEAWYVPTTYHSSFGLTFFATRLYFQSRRNESIYSNSRRARTHIHFRQINRQINPLRRTNIPSQRVTLPGLYSPLLQDPLHESTLC